MENARLYTLPDEPPPVLVSGFGPKSIALAARIGDGYCATMPEASFVERYRAAGGKGPAQGGVKVCWGPDEDECVKTVHRLWPNEGLPGELAQVLPTPRHFEQAVGARHGGHDPRVGARAARTSTATSRPCRPTPTRASTSSTSQQVGPRQEEFLELFAREVLPRFR